VFHNESFFDLLIGDLCSGETGTYSYAITYTNLYSTLLLDLEIEKSEHFSATDLTG
jgi:hypothetical protein